MKQRLFDVTATRRWRGSRSLVPCDPTACPTCGGPLEVETIRVDALLRHGGYGATRQETRRHCPGCGWSILSERSEERPPQQAAS